MTEVKGEVRNHTGDAETREHQGNAGKKDLSIDERNYPISRPDCLRYGAKNFDLPVYGD